METTKGFDLFAEMAKVDLFQAQALVGADPVPPGQAIAGVLSDNLLRMYEVEYQLVNELNSFADELNAALEAQNTAVELATECKQYKQQIARLARLESIRNIFMELVLLENPSVSNRSFTICEDGKIVVESEEEYDGKFGVKEIAKALGVDTQYVTVVR